MNAVIGMSRILLESDLSPDLMDCAETIESSGNQLMAVIDDILDFSKIESGKLKLVLEPLDLPWLLESVCNLVSMQAATKGLGLTFVLHPDIPTMVLGDLVRIRQILLNLLSNAIKFTEKGNIVVKLEPKPRLMLGAGARVYEDDDDLEGHDVHESSRLMQHIDNGSSESVLGQMHSGVPSVVGSGQRQPLNVLGGSSLRIPNDNRQQRKSSENQVDLLWSVVDQGCGIPAERMSRLFKSFSQADDSVTRNFGGTGLGLAISKKLAEFMDGEMWAESEEGVGSTFYFTTLLESPDASVNVAQQLNLAFYKDKRLLILDDRRVSRTSWQYQSSAWGFQRTMVLSVQKGLDFLRQNPNQVDVIMIDVDKTQAKINPGLAVLEQIRAISYEDSSSSSSSSSDGAGAQGGGEGQSSLRVPCVLISYPRRGVPAQQTGLFSVAAKTSNGLLSSTSPAMTQTSDHPVSLVSASSSHESLPDSLASSESSKEHQSVHGESLTLAVDTVNGPSCLNSLYTPNISNSGMLAVKPYTSLRHRSKSSSSMKQSGPYNNQAIPTGLETDPLVGHLIKPVKQAKLFSMLHGLMTGSWPEAPLAVPDSDHREHERRQQLESLQCLLVDDNPVNQKVISRMLDRIGIKVELANNGQEAVDKCRARAEAVALARSSSFSPEQCAMAAAAASDGLRQYDIVFIDVWMPIKDGLEATREIRATVDGITSMDPFIVAMTACVMPGDREKCIESGMNAYLSKPIKKEELCSILERWLDDRAHAEAERQKNMERKTIQRKKREMLRRKSMAVLTGTRQAGVEEVDASAPAIPADVGQWQQEQQVQDDSSDEDDDEEEELVEGETMSDAEEDMSISQGRLMGTDDLQLVNMKLEGGKLRKGSYSRQPRQRRQRGHSVLIDTEGMLGCRSGGGGGLKMLSVAAEAQLAAKRLSQKHRQDRQERGKAKMAMRKEKFRAGGRSRLGSFSVDPTAGVLQLETSVEVGSTDDDDDDDEDNEDDNEDDDDYEDEDKEDDDSPRSGDSHSYFGQGPALEQTAS
ncbi:hypothetical protein BGZ98_001338 [Dissophora globulifera]|nr:hypothetical protein BGZ98_001338 [Dissophora globulifera]